MCGIVKVIYRTLHRSRMGCVVRFALGFQFAAVLAEPWQMRQADALSSELERGGQHTKSVSYTAPEVDRGCFLKILSGTRYFPDAETEVYALCQHLVIENEI